MGVGEECVFLYFIMQLRAEDPAWNIAFSNNILDQLELVNTSEKNCYFEERVSKANEAKSKS